VNVFAEVENLLVEPSTPSEAAPSGLYFARNSSTSWVWALLRATQLPSVAAMTGMAQVTATNTGAIQ